MTTILISLDLSPVMAAKIDTAIGSHVNLRIPGDLTHQVVLACHSRAQAEALAAAVNMPAAAEKAEAA